jgi:hypothetical protein
MTRVLKVGHPPRVWNGTSRFSSSSQCWTTMNRLASEGMGRFLTIRKRRSGEMSKFRLIPSRPIMLRMGTRVPSHHDEVARLLATEGEKVGAARLVGGSAPESPQRVSQRSDCWNTRNGNLRLEKYWKRQKLRICARRARRESRRIQIMHALLRSRRFPSCVLAQRA